jgi:hypothetical protein
MPGLRSSTAIFEEEFLPVRAKLLEVAAALDRMDRADDDLDSVDPRMKQLRAAMETLLRDECDRAEQLQLIFSRPYEDDWREKFHLTE